ncbi:MAG: DEAD/DEAH box helicase, partial [Firmicutes bacterium]|nr:DEAD/DEAH box helicase [Bacillota bacterium]
DFLPPQPLAQAIEALKQPAEAVTDIPRFLGTLRSYQAYAVGWLKARLEWGIGVLLADDMGLGKTVEIIAMLLSWWETHPQDTPVLIICPLSVIRNWEQEWEHFSQNVLVGCHVGSQRVTGDDWAAWTNKFDVVLTTYDVLSRDHQFMKEIHWAGIIVDEAQHLKNHHTKRAQALRCLSSKWRIALTGTPVENRLRDLWAIIEFLNPDFLGPEDVFREEYERPIALDQNAHVAEDLRNMIAPFVLRRLKTDPLLVPDLPPKTEINEWASLTNEQAGLYQAIVQKLLGTIGQLDQHSVQRRGAILAGITYLKQVVNHPAQYLRQKGPIAGRSGKLMRLEQILEDILQVQERTVIFTQYVQMGRILFSYLPKKFQSPVLFLHGGLPKAERDHIIETFQKDSSSAILVSSLKAGGVGLNLAMAQHVIHYDRWWNPAVEDQATDRVWRLGQQQRVTVHKLITRGTIEDRIDQLITAKRRIGQSIIETMNSEQWITTLDNEQIRDFLMLG